MNAVTTTWRQLVRRRLWPVAVLLVAALVAVPVLLARDAEPVAAPASSRLPPTRPRPTTRSPSRSSRRSTAADRGRRRRVLGCPQGPVRARPGQEAEEEGQDGRRSRPTDTHDPALTAGGGRPRRSAAPGRPSKPKPKAYPAGSLIVRFGDADGRRAAQVGRCASSRPLPDDDDAADRLHRPHQPRQEGRVPGRRSRSRSTGDGTCKPHPSSCETIELAAGETEFFDVIDPETGEITRRTSSTSSRSTLVPRGTRSPPRLSRSRGGACLRRMRRRAAARHHRRGVPRPGPHLHRRGPARGPRARPRRDRSRHGPPPARPRPRRPDEDRARQRRGHRRRPPRPHARRPDRRPRRQPRLRQLGGADEPVAGRGRRAGGAPPAPRPRRPRRRPEVRLHRRAQRARARERA